MSNLIDLALQLALATTDELLAAVKRLKGRLPKYDEGTETGYDWDGSVGAFCEVREELKRRGQWKE
jgi:hypothetical protein